MYGVLYVRVHSGAVRFMGFGKCQNISHFHNVKCSFNERFMCSLCLCGPVFTSFGKSVLGFVIARLSLRSSSAFGTGTIWMVGHFL